MNINIYVPSAIAIYSTGVITSAYFIEYVLGYKPCELCVLQRYPYFVIILSSILLMVHKNKLISVEISNFILAKSYIIIALASLTGLSIATYHYGIENSYWQNLTGCSDRLSNINLNTTDLLEGINTFEPNCSDPLMFFGVSLSGYNVISNIFILSITVLTFLKYKKKLQ